MLLECSADSQRCRAKATLSAFLISSPHLTPVAVPPPHCPLVPDALPALPVLFALPPTPSPVLVESGTRTLKLSSDVTASTSSPVTKTLMLPQFDHRCRSETPVCSRTRLWHVRPPPCPSACGSWLGPHPNPVPRTELLVRAWRTLLLDCGSDWGGHLQRLRALGPSPSQQHGVRWGCRD